MKTWILVICTLGLMGAMGSASAIGDPLNLAELLDQATNPCNGITDENCECPADTLFCQAGQKCSLYVYPVCVKG